MDFVVETERGPVAIEVKSSQRCDPRSGAGLGRFRSEHPETRSAWDVYCGARALQVGDLRVLPWKTFLRQLAEGAIVGRW